VIDCCVAASGALLGIPVGLAHGVVEVDEHQLVGVGQDRGRGREPGQQPGGHVPAEQSEMFAVYRYHAVFTDNTEPMLAAEATHRDHAIIEQVIAELKNGPADSTVDPG
jgi:hypothetical protein